MNRFIALEGIEGTGKSTLVRRIATLLGEAGHAVLITREPGGCPIADRLRAIVVEGSAEIEPLAELLIFQAARAQHVAEIIKPALLTGKTVLCDRFTGSSLALQGYGRGLDIGLIRELSCIATAGLSPALTLLLDVPVEIGLERAMSRGGAARFEALGEAFHGRVRAGYLTEANNDGSYEVIDATVSPDEVFTAAVAILQRRGFV